jgi:hypothetical protein
MALHHRAVNPRSGDLDLLYRLPPAAAESPLRLTVALANETEGLGQNPDAKAEEDERGANLDCSLR